MRNFSYFLICCLLPLAISGFTWWWLIALIAFLAAFLLKLTRKPAFLLGFLAGLLSWAVMILIVDHSNESRLSTQMAELLGCSHYLILILLNSSIAALLGGFGGLTGASLSKLINNRNEESLSQKPNEPIEESLNLNDLKELRPEWKDKDHI